MPLLQLLRPVLGIALGRSVLTLGILRPVEREATADEPFAEVSIAHGAGRNGPSVLIQRDRDTRDRPSRDESVKIIRGLSAAAVKRWGVHTKEWPPALPQAAQV
jgi:hypothetical protein